MSLDPKKLKIVIHPHPKLRAVAEPIPEITEEVRAVARRMLQLTREAPGVGLAAPQVGLSWRLFVACPTQDTKDDVVFINPVLSNPGKELVDYEEGCLSLPKVYAEIRRPKQITIEATNLSGEKFELTSDDMPARIWQHEYDHLDGVLIIDKMTPLDRMANLRIIKTLELKAKLK
jgi:peptide deformylase